MDDLFGVTEIAKQIHDEEAHHEHAAAEVTDEKKAVAAPEATEHAENKE